MYESLFSTELLIGNRHDTAVVLGWYPMKSFEKRFDKSLYGVAGNLFNPEFGVRLLIRNLLYNTQIKNIILCDITIEDKTNSPCESLERNLNTDYYQNLGKHLSIFRARNLEDLLDILTVISGTEMNISPTRLVEYLESSTPTVKIIPGNIHSQTITKKTIKSAFPEVIKQIRNHGRMVADIQEFSNLNICLTDEETSIADILDAVDSDKKESLELYIDNFLNGTRSEHSYSYGDRLIEGNQVQNVVKKLEEKLLTMSAVMVLYHPEDLVKGNSPCLTQIWVRVNQRNQLEMSATFRSNDMFRAWEFNTYALRALQIHIVNALNILPGTLTTISFSAHIYQKEFEVIDKFLREQKSKEFVLKEYYSSVGNFVITTEDLPTKIIKIQQMTNNGELAFDWEITLPTAHKIHKLMEEICDKNPSIEISHLLYLYRELNRALYPHFTQL